MNIRGIRTKRGGKININSVTRMLHNRKYIVEFKYRDIIQPNGSLTVFLFQIPYICLTGYSNE